MTPTPAQQTDHTPTWTFVEETEYTSAHLRREVDGRCASAGDEFVLASAHAALQAEKAALVAENAHLHKSLDVAVYCAFAKDKRLVALQEQHAALVAALECEEALHVPYDDGVRTLRRHGWVSGEDTAQQFVARLRRAALKAAQEQPHG